MTILGKCDMVLALSENTINAQFKDLFDNDEISNEWNILVRQITQEQKTSYEAFIYFANKEIEEKYLKDIKDAESISSITIVSDKKILEEKSKEEDLLTEDQLKLLKDIKNFFEQIKTLEKERDEAIDKDDLSTVKAKKAELENVKKEVALKEEELKGKPIGKVKPYYRWDIKLKAPMIALSDDPRRVSFTLPFESGTLFDWVTNRDQVQEHKLNDTHCYAFDVPIDQVEIRGTETILLRKARGTLDKVIEEGDLDNKDENGNYKPIGQEEFFIYPLFLKFQNANISTYNKEKSSLPLKDATIFQIAIENYFCDIIKGSRHPYVLGYSLTLTNKKVVELEEKALFSPQVLRYSSSYDAEESQQYKGTYPYSAFNYLMMTRPVFPGDNNVGMLSISLLKKTRILKGIDELKYVRWKAEQALALPQYPSVPFSDSQNKISKYYTQLQVCNDLRNKTLKYINEAIALLDKNDFKGAEESVKKIDISALQQKYKEIEMGVIGFPDFEKALLSLDLKSIPKTMDATFGIDFNLFYEKYLSPIVTKIESSFTEFFNQIKEGEGSTQKFMGNFSGSVTKDGNQNPFVKQSNKQFSKKVHLKLKGNETSAAGNTYSNTDYIMEIDFEGVIEISIGSEISITCKLYSETKYVKDPSWFFWLTNTQVIHTSNKSSRGFPSGFVITITPVGNGGTSVTYSDLQGKEVIKNEEGDESGSDAEKLELVKKVKNTLFGNNIDFLNNIKNSIDIKEIAKNIREKMDASTESWPKIIFPLGGVYTYKNMRLYSETYDENDAVLLEAAYSPEYQP